MGARGFRHQSDESGKLLLGLPDRPGCIRPRARGGLAERGVQLIGKLCDPIMPPGNRPLVEAGGHGDAAVPEQLRNYRADCPDS